MFGFDLCVCVFFFKSFCFFFCITIERPMTIHNCKFDIRQWFLVTSIQPLIIWMYKESYLRFSSQEYNLSNLHESVHLTNHAVLYLAIGMIKTIIYNLPTFRFKSVMKMGTEMNDCHGKTCGITYRSKLTCGKSVKVMCG